MGLLDLQALLTASQAETSSRFDLRENWLVQSSCKVDMHAEVLSTAQFSPEHWYKTTVPSTVLAAQVANGEFKDIYFAENLRKLPGMDYRAKEMPSGRNNTSENPYLCSWWYRTEFQVPQKFRGQRVWLHFNGISYRANVWLNGRKLADAKAVAGAYRIYASRSGFVGIAVARRFNSFKVANPQSDGTIREPVGFAC